MIRECDARSISEVIELGENWAEQHKVETFDSSAWHNLIRSYCTHDHCVWLNFVDQANRVRGFVAGTAMVAPHINAVTAQIQIVYLHPDHQEHENLYALHEEFVKWSKKYKCVSVMAPTMIFTPDYISNFFDEIGYQAGPTLRFKGVE